MSKTVPSFGPIVTRSKVVLEIASELVTLADQPFKQVKVLMRTQGEPEQDWPLRLFGSSTYEGLDAVVARESAISMINPAAALTLAYRGSPPYDRPQPVRTIAVIPSLDQIVLATHPSIGIARLEEIGARRLPLRISVRGQRDHCIHFMLEDMANAAGFSLRDFERWGGRLIFEGSIPTPNTKRFNMLVSGEVDAIFDEAASFWLNEALTAGMTILRLPDGAIRKLEALGYRRGVLQKALYPGLAEDVASIDFSGWPIFVHAELDDVLVGQICRALDARKHLIPWEGNGPLPVERMCREAPDTPQDIPLHRAAEKCWREFGYL
jgi:hypothetical protein